MEITVICWKVHKMCKNSFTYLSDTETLLQKCLIIRILFLRFLPDYYVKYLNRFSCTKHKIGYKKKTYRKFHSVV